MLTQVLEKRSKEGTQDQTVSFDQTTKEFAKIWRVEAATVRRGYCVNGHYMGVKPLKLPNGRLLWPKSNPSKVVQPVKSSDGWEE